MTTSISTAPGNLVVPIYRYRLVQEWMHPDGAWRVHFDFTFSSFLPCPDHVELRSEINQRSTWTGGGSPAFHVVALGGSWEEIEQYGWTWRRLRTAKITGGGLEACDAAGMAERGERADLRMVPLGSPLPGPVDRTATVAERIEPERRHITSEIDYTPPTGPRAPTRQLGLFGDADVEADAEMAGVAS